MEELILPNKTVTNASQADQQFGRDDFMSYEIDNFSQKRYVLIDDDPTYRAIMVRVARNAGMNCDAYESLMDLGYIGLIGRYDAAIIDYNLGGLNGLEIAEYLAAMFSDIPMVMISEKDRQPDQKAWPSSIKKFVKKSDGYLFTLEQAAACTKRK